MTMTAVGDETCPIPSNQVEESVTVMISFNNESGCQSGGSLLQHHDYWVDVIQLHNGDGVHKPKLERGESLRTPTKSRNE